MGEAGPRQRALAAALAGAAALSAPGETTAADPGELLGWLRDTAATAVYLTPPLLRALAAVAAGGLRLRHVFVANSGDFTGKDVECLRRLVPGCRVVGVYHGDDGDRPLALYEVPAHWAASTAPLRVPIGVALQPASLLGGPGSRPRSARSPSCVSAAAGPVTLSAAGPTACWSSPRLPLTRWRRPQPCATLPVCRMRP